jgi:hypothetical protein
MTKGKKSGNNVIDGPLLAVLKKVFEQFVFFFLVFCPPNHISNNIHVVTGS